MKTNPKDILTRVDGLFAEVKQLQKENESLAAKLSNIEAGNLTDSVMTVDGVNVLAAKVNVADMNNLRTMMDDLKNKLESTVVVLASVNDDKVNIPAGVTKDLISQGYHAGKLRKKQLLVAAVAVVAVLIWHKQAVKPSSSRRSFSICTRVR